LVLDNAPENLTEGHLVSRCCYFGVQQLKQE